MRIEQLKKNSITELALLTNILNDGLFRYFNMAYFKKSACSIAIGLQDTWGIPALKAERKRGRINMCNALEELVNEGVERGRQEGISVNIKVCKRFNMSKIDVIQGIMKDFSVSEKKQESMWKCTGRINLHK